MKNFFERLLGWARRGADFWLVIIPLMVTIALYFLLRDYSSGLNLFRLIGIVIELLGLATVVVSLSREAKKNNFPEYFVALAQWLQEFKYVFTPRNVTASLGSCQAHGSSSVMAALSTGRNFNNIEEKVAYLMEFVLDLERAIETNRVQVVKVKQDLMNEVNILKNTFQQEIVGIKEELKDKATIDYYLLVSGALLTTIGMIMTNLPDDYYHCFLLFK